MLFTTYDAPFGVNRHIHRLDRVADSLSSRWNHLILEPVDAGGTLIETVAPVGIMEASSDRRLFGMCLLASILGFVVWLLVVPEANAAWIFGIAILALAAMRFIDGYLAAT